MNNSTSSSFYYIHTMFITIFLFQLFMKILFFSEYAFPFVWVRFRSIYFLAFLLYERYHYDSTPLLVSIIRMSLKKIPLNAYLYFLKLEGISFLRNLLYMYLLDAYFTFGITLAYNSIQTMEIIYCLIETPAMIFLLNSIFNIFRLLFFWILTGVVTTTISWVFTGAVYSLIAIFIGYDYTNNNYINFESTDTPPRTPNIEEFLYSNWTYKSLFYEYADCNVYIPFIGLNYQPIPPLVKSIIHKSMLENGLGELYYMQPLNKWTSIDLLQFSMEYNDKIDSPEVCYTVLMNNNQIPTYKSAPEFETPYQILQNNVSVYLVNSKSPILIISNSLIYLGASILIFLTTTLLRLWRFLVLNPHACA